MPGGCCSAKPKKNASLRNGDLALVDAPVLHQGVRSAENLFANVTKVTMLLANPLS